MNTANKIENFTIARTGDSGDFTLADAAGKYVVLYFYPKDDTPGCTLEGKDFSTMLDDFTSTNCLVFGISRDNLRSHEKFRAKFNYRHHLLADTDQTLCQQFNVLKEKNMYGKKVIGISRGTFLIAPDGTLAKEWRDIKDVTGHAQEVLDSVRQHAADNV